jgi:SAM-dependent methyltransferase
MIGRRFPSWLGTSHSRRAFLPGAAALELAEAAKIAGEPVFQVSAGERVPDKVVYVPELVSYPDQDNADLSDKLTVHKIRADQAYRRDYFETIFATRDDPWKYTSDYERVKYEQTLGLISNEQFARGLEIGCAEGHFTGMLAPLVDHLVAADISEIALQRASERCADFHNIRYMQLDLTKDALQGSFDLIVCSETLYFVGDREALKTVVQKIVNALNPGGYFLTAHAHLVIDEPDKPGLIGICLLVRRPSVIV